MKLHLWKTLITCSKVVVKTKNLKIFVSTTLLDVNTKVHDIIFCNQLCNCITGLSSSRSVYLSTSPIFEYPHSMTTSSSDFIIATSTSMFTTDSSQFTTSSIHSHILSTTDSSKFITSSSETLETPTTVLITVRAGSVDSDIANIIIILIASICAGLLIGVITALFFCLAFCQRRISNK